MASLKELLREMIQKINRTENEKVSSVNGITPDESGNVVIEVSGEETDPTVPAWAKQPTKPEYTAAEVGALPDTYTPPAAPVQSVNGKTGTVNLTAEDVGALPDDTQIPTVPDWVKPIAAEVGQHFRVSSVDENGNVSAVEAVDAPSGGGEGLWEHICDITTTEEIDAGIIVTENSKGVPLSELKYNEIWVMAKMVGIDTNTNNWWGCWCYSHYVDIGNVNPGGRTNGALSGGTTGTRYVSYYHFIRGNKAYWTDGNKADVFCVDGGNEAWIDNYLDNHQVDYFEKVEIAADETRVIGVDTEIRILGRRA